MFLYLLSDSFIIDFIFIQIFNLLDLVVFIILAEQ